MKLKIFIFSVLLFQFFQSNGQIYREMPKVNMDSLLLQLTSADGTEKIDILNRLSVALLIDDTDSSLRSANLAIALSEKLDYQKGKADGFFNLGNCYYILDEFQPTTNYYLKALRTYEDLDPSVEEGIVNLQLGDLNSFSGRYKEALSYFHRALSNYQKLNHKKGILRSNYLLAYHHWILESYDSSFYFSDTGLTYLDSVGDRYERVIIYLQYARTYREQFFKSGDTTMLDKTIQWLLKSLEVQDTSKYHIAGIYYNLGSYLMDYQNPEKTKTSKYYFDKVIPIAKNCKDACMFEPMMYRRTGVLQNEQHNPDSALILLHMALELMERELSLFSIQDFSSPVKAYESRWVLKRYLSYTYANIYTVSLGIKDYEMALKYYRLYEKSKEERSFEKNKNLISLLETEMQNEQTKNQITLLEKENEVKSLSIKQSRTYIFAITAFIIILFLLTFLYFRQRKIRLEHTTLIREQKLLHDLEIKNVESEKLKELDHLKSRFFANISHEFRTPLTLIMGPLEKVLSNTREDHNKKELGIVKKYAGKLQVLINNLLTISKLESGKMQLHASETDIVKLSRTFIQAFESLANQKHIFLSFSSEEKVIKAFIDKEKFEQVLNNLLSNAFKFTEDGGGIKVAVGSSQSAVDSGLTEDWKLKSADLGGQWVSIEISDTGCGISPKHTNHIFDRFYQIEHEDNSYYNGTGIGLSLTKELVELHHGQISVESKKGEGSTFTILLPLGKEHLKPEEITVDKPVEITTPVISTAIPEDCEDSISVTENNNSQPILLIVEDNIDMRFYIQEYFENEYHIIEAVDGLDGYEKSTEHIPDIIISDVMMPRMDGNEFCRKVKSDERTSHIPVILLTARASSEYKIEGLETGADDYISKPFDPKELQVRVKNLIEQRKRIRKILEEKIQTSKSVIHINFADSGVTSMDEQFLKKVFENVRLHHAEPQFNAQEFGDVIGLSAAQLNRKIKALTGKTTGEFIRAFRLARAVELIAKKSATIAEIAYEVGFSSPSYFAECFRLHFGKSPSEYAENN